MKCAYTANYVCDEPRRSGDNNDDNQTAIQKTLSNALVLVARRVKALLMVILNGGFAVRIPRMRGWFTDLQRVQAGDRFFCPAERN